jgi:hypothetical protein
MPKMDGNGPEKQGAKTGRKLGVCSNNEEKDTSMFGIGMGKRRNSYGGKGLGKRLKYNTNK